MVRFTYRGLNEAHLLTMDWTGGGSGNTVLVSIYDMVDNAADVANAAMTSETGGTFSYSWTPTESHTFRIDYYNQTLNSHEYEMVSVQDASTAVAGSTEGSTFANLRSRFLRLIDNYNANDLSGTNSSGDIADLCINDALQTIYATIKASRYTEYYSSTSLASVADQAYIALSAISNIDEIVSIKDTSNQQTLIEMKAEDYFRYVSNPANATGTPSHYVRIFNRIYLHPRPTAVITYTTEYRRTYPRLVNDGDRALIPSKYDRWINAEAWVIWLMGEDPNAVGAIGIAQKERERCEYKFLNDIFSNFDFVPQSASHFLETGWSGRRNYDSPIDGT